jgi:hypothetical protein
MNTNTTYFFSFFYMVWAMALPVLAQSECTGQECLRNPLRFPSIEKFIEGVLQAVVMIALPIIVLFMVYAGFKYIFARGNSGKITDAHKNFTYVIIGTALILGAWVLATLIGGTVTQLLRG